MGKKTGVYKKGGYAMNDRLKPASMNFSMMMSNLKLQSPNRPALMIHNLCQYIKNAGGYIRVEGDRIKAKVPGADKQEVVAIKKLLTLHSEDATRIINFRNRLGV